MRLIDADELIKILEEYENDEGSKAIYGEENLSLILGDCKIEIERLPTAYDVDKVVERFEKDKKELEEIIKSGARDIYKNTNYGYFTAMNRAVEIVKSGGIE